MKTILFTTILVASLGASSAHANEVFSETSVSSGLSGVSAEAAQNLSACLHSNIDTASSKAIRACSKAYKASIPLYDIRSDILTRRGLLQLSAGRFDKASRDFESAAKLNADNEFANLGKGYAAIMQQDYAAAANYFKDCRDHKKAAPLAAYGMAMTKELTGDIKGALASYEQAAKMLPEWTAPRAELARIKQAS